MLAAVVTTAVVSAVVSASPTCDIGAGHVVKRVEDAAPALMKSRFAKLFHGLKAVDPESTLDVDERHVKFLLVGDKQPAPLKLPLALPAPYTGVVDLTPRDPKGERWCADVDVVLFDKDLRAAVVSGLPLDVNVTAGKKGALHSLAVGNDTLVFTPDTLEAKLGDATPMRLYVGDGPPEDAVLEVDGADLYLRSLAALDTAIVDDIRAHPSPQAQRVLFAELAASLRSALRTWTPDKRISEIARFDEKAMPEDLRPLVHFWKTELGPQTANKEAPAHIIIDDAVQALWIDGASVFDRKRGTPTGFDLPVPAQAVRAWIVTVEGGAAVVHDTRAVLKGGEIYSVTSTLVQPVKGGSRRECVRVVGELPEGKDIRWREISGTHSAMLGDDETYRPSASAAERALSVVPGGDSRPFPPVPLVYSYTHPGLYKWTLAKDGSVKLELIADEAVCKRK